jgi:hypothetical protein
MKIDQQQLQAILKYDPISGAFFRLSTGENTGTINTKGYVVINIGNHRAELAHRLAWLYVFGCWPTNQIDHIDRDKTNNAIRNLRDTNGSVNQQNQITAHSHNRSGIIGVRRTPSGTFLARIVVGGKQIHIGTYPTKELASSAYIEAKQRLHPHAISQC